MASVALNTVRMRVERREACQPKGYGALVRAMRSRSPGAVLAHAAASAESDPLAEPDARLFVGLRPLTA